MKKNKDTKKQRSAADMAARRKDNSEGIKVMLPKKSSK